MTVLTAALMWAALTPNARLLIEAPPRHGKSETTSFWLPTWYLDNFPHRRVILASHGADLATWFSKRARNTLASSEHVMTRAAGAANDWETDKGGGCRSIGMGGSINGRGGDLIILDDAHKNWEEAYSDTLREKTKDWCKTTLFLRTEPGASIINVQTRWHEHDVGGWLQAEHGDEWRRVALPAIAEENDPLGRDVGEALCPERYPIDRLLKTKGLMGSRMFAGLFQQRPAPEGGAIVKDHWIRYYDEMPTHGELLTAWDMTFKGTGSSYVCGQTWLDTGSALYLLDQVRAKLDFPDTLRAVKAMHERWPAARIIIEDAANGPAVIASLQGAVPSIEGIRVSGTKEVRFIGVSGIFESGAVHVPRESNNPWVAELKHEWTHFPGSKNNDQVDATSLALHEMRKPRERFFLV
jgi:predicted phage terminase large subunit-like protein